MENKNCELLFEYLRSILYDSEVKEFNPLSVEEPYRKLGLGLQVLQQFVSELKEYSANLSTGNLSGDTPSRDNFLCANLKNLHANLNHLTWQAKQVASGDYSQHIAYLGEFSEAFNLMTKQLAEREKHLREESEKSQEQLAVIESYNELLMTMTRKWNEWVIVVDEKTKEILYCNKENPEDGKTSSFCAQCRDRLPFFQKILDWNDKDQYHIWEENDSKDTYYRITSFPVEWRGHRSYVHIIIDVTGDERKARELSEQAYHDSLTGIYNRLFFEKTMKELIDEKKLLTLCYMDLDGLKFVNDHFGHREGDLYLKSFVSVIQDYFYEPEGFFRIGGDEFCLLFKGCRKEQIDKELEEARSRFRENHSKSYHSTFSYGVVEIDKWTEDMNFTEILRKADEAMYQYKRQYGRNSYRF